MASVYHKIPLLFVVKQCLCRMIGGEGSLVDDCSFLEFNVAVAIGRRPSHRCYRYGHTSSQMQVY